MKKSIIPSLFTIITVIFLSISCSDNVQDGQDVKENEPPNVEKFAQSTEFRNLVNTSKEVISIQSEHFQQISKDEKSAYINELNKLTKILKENPTKENLKTFADYAGFNNLNEFMNLYKVQKNAKKKLGEQFPAFANLNNDHKSDFLKRATIKLRGYDNPKEEDVINSAGPCEDNLEAHRTVAYGVATGALLACGQSAGGVALLNVFVGAAYYGVCAGAVYATLNAELESAQAEYELCIS